MGDDVSRAGERRNEKSRDLHLSWRNVGCAPLSIQNLD
jgi:hypothetical protein